MILEALINSIVFSIEAVLKLLPPLPVFPETLNYSINRFLDLVFDNLSLLDIFLPINLIKVCALTMVGLLTFCYLYSAIKHIFKTFNINV